MSLTPEEIAMCRDAMLEAGVPPRFVDEVTGIVSRLRVFYCQQNIDYEYAKASPGAVKYAKDMMYMEIGKKLMEDGVVKIEEGPNPYLDAIAIRARLLIVTPSGWKPPQEPR